MSVTVDNRIVNMQFDNSKFESNVSTTMESLKNLKKSLEFKDAHKGFENITKSALNTDISPIGSAVESVKLKFSALEVIAVTALANITNSAINAGKRIVSALAIDPIRTGFSEYETQINAVQTILANTSSKGTNLTQVNRTLDELNTYADKTIYNFTEMTRNLGTFTAAGISLEDSAKGIKGIANLAAVSGSTSQQASTAMYQLSQALSSGTVRLQDWNSVVNAGMGGEVFRNALLETAKVHGKSVGKVISGEKTFRESLQEGWLTSEVLMETLSKFTGDLNQDQLKTMGYTNEQISSIIKMGEMANDAATKVKTFTQLFDTLKEAAQSGWTQSWEIIVGDFEEARDLLTNISDVFGGIINEASEARNKVLEKGLSSGWKQFLKQGIPDEDKFKEKVKSVAKSQGLAVDEIIEKAGSFDKSLKENWLNSNILAKSISELVDETKDLSKEELEAKGYTLEQARQLKELNEQVKNGSISLEEFANQMSKASGRENAIQGLKNVLSGIASIIKPIGQAFKEIFSPITGEKLYAFTQGFKELTEKFKITETQSNNLKNTFKGLFAITSVIGKVIKFIVDVIGIFIPSLGKASNGILGLTGGLGTWLVKLNELIDKSGIFNKALEFISKLVNGFSEILSKVIDKTSGLREKISILIEWLKEKFETPGFSGFKALLETIKDIFDALGEKATSFKDKVIAVFKAIKEAIDWDTVNNGIGSFSKLLHKLFEFANKAAGVIAKGFKTIGFGIVNAFKNGDMNTFISLVNGGLLATALVAIKKFFKGSGDAVGKVTNIPQAILNVFNGMSGVIGGAKKALDGVRESLSSYQENIKAKTLLTIASSVAILVGSIILLSMIDADKLAISIGAITTLFAELVVSMKQLGKMDKGMLGATKAATLMVTMSISISILAGALSKLAKLKIEELSVGIVGVGALLFMLIKTVEKMSSINGKMIKGATSLIFLSIAVNTLANAVKKLADLSIKELIKGLAGVGILLAEISLFLNNTKFSAKAPLTATGMLIMAGAVKMLASSVKIFGELDINTLIKGISAIELLLTELAIFSNLTGNAKHVISTGIAMTLLSIALKNISPVLAQLGNLSLEQIGKGLLSLAGALGIITVSLNVMPKNMIGIGTGLIIVSTAISTISNSLIKLGNLSLEQVCKGLLALGGALSILAVALNVMKGTLGGSASLTVAAIALGLLTPVLVILGGLSWSAIAKGLVAIAGAFTILGVAGVVLAPLAPVLLMISGALTLMGVAVMALGAGLVLVGAGLASLAAGILAFAGISTIAVEAFINIQKTIIMALVGLLPAIIVEVGKGIIQLCDILIAATPKIVETVVVIVGSVVTGLITLIPLVVDAVFQILDAVLKKVVEYTPSIVSSLMDFLILFLQGIAEKIDDVVIAAIDVALAFIDGIAQKIPDVIQAAFDLIISFINGLTDAINNNTPLIVEAIKGLMLALVNAAVQVLLGAVSFFVEAGVSIVTGLISGISSIVGNLIETVASFMSSMLEGVTGKVSDFKEAGVQLIIGFINGIKDKLKDAVEGIKEFGSGVVDGLKGVLGIHSPSRVAAELGGFFGQGFSQGVDGSKDGVAKSADSLASGSVGAVNNALKAMQAAITNSCSSFENGGKLIVLSINNGMIPEMQILLSNFKQFLAQLLELIKIEEPNFNLEGGNLIVSFKTGIESYSDSVKETFKEVLSKSLDGMREKKQEFIDLAKYLSDGLIDGIRSKISEVKEQAREMARAAAEAMESELDIHSPSRVFYKIGAFAGKGFINALGDYTDSAEYSAKELASKTVSSLSKAISAVSDFINNDIDNTPTIRPVLDLSNVEKNAGKLNSILGYNKALNISWQFSNDSMGNSNLTRGDSVYNFVQNNYSPKALSRIDIYRNTKNQLGMVRRVNI